MRAIGRVRNLLRVGDRHLEGTAMPHRKHPLKTMPAHPRDHHRQMLLAVLYLCAVVLIINAWLVSQQLIAF